MKYITPSTVISFIAITVVSVASNMALFAYLKEQDNPQLSFILIAITQIILMAIFYSVCFAYMKAKLRTIDQAIINKDLNSLHEITEHSDESSELSSHLEELLVEEQIDKLHLKLDDQVSLDSTADGRQTLRELLTTIAIKTEELSHDAHCSISLIDDSHTKLHNIAAPNLPEAFIKTIDDTEIGAGIASCQNTAATGVATLVSNIFSHPNWKHQLAAATLTSYKACWSYPLKNEAKETIGTLAIYYSEVKEHCPLDEQILKSSAEMTELIIQRYQKNNAI